MSSTRTRKTCYGIEGAGLHPRSVTLDDLSFDKKKQSIHIGFDLDWKEYQELLEMASTPLVH